MWLIALLVMGSGEPEDVREPTATIDEQPAENVAVETAQGSVPVRIYVRNEMSRRFRLVEARVVLDETEVVHRNAAGGNELERQFSALETPVPPGEHALTATLVYEGRNAGPFSYLDNYKFRVKTSYPFDLDRSQETAAIHVVAREKPGANVPLEQRPLIEVMAAPDSGVKPMPGVTEASGHNVVRLVSP
jgi:hypothetical protein